MRDDGLVVGSVSGGCVEDDLIDRVRNGERVATPSLVTYGVSKEEAARFGLPCGGNLRLVQEPLGDTAWIAEVLDAHRAPRAGRPRRRPRQRRGPRSSRRAAARPSRSTAARCARSFGPRWRMLVIGAGQLSRFARADGARPRLRGRSSAIRARNTSLAWDVPGTTFSTAMPDDLAIELQLDPHTAVVAVTHDPKLDDLALLEALKSPAFYVGALGSRGNTAKRKERLALFDLSAAEIARLHGPIGLDIGSKTPAEIAVVDPGRGRRGQERRRR